MNDPLDPAPEAPRDLEAEALASCDREPIHVPGTVQSCGTLLAVDTRTRLVLYAAANLGEYLGVAYSDALGEPIEKVFDREILHALQNAVCVPTIQTQRVHLGVVRRDDQRLFVAVHERAGRYILEIEPQVDEHDNVLSGVERVRWLVAETSTETERQRLLEESVRQLRAISGYDRVMAYTFAPDGSGEVVAESRAGHAESYLGQRFPPSDIPQRARELYRSTPIRVIADVHAATVPIHAGSAELGDLDLSLSSLRGTAEVHIQYLKNMGVRSTMTLPIICEGELWGLFAAHSLAPMNPGPSTKLSLELSGKLLSMQLEQLLRLRHERLLHSSVSVASTLVAVDDSELSSTQYWPAANEQLRKMLPSNGVAYCVAEHVDMAGSCPPAEICQLIVGLVDPASDSMTAVDSLKKVMPEAEFGDVGGALIVPLRAEPRVTLLFFRDLISKTVLWAGRPEKDIEVSERGIRLLPRGSFDCYQETVVDQCDSWTREDLEIARSLRDSLSELLKTQRDMRENRHRLGLLVRELNHRVRNILTLIGSLAAHRSSAAASIEEYVEALRKRIVALAETHELMTARGFEDVPLRSLAAKELRPFLSDAGVDLALHGPAVDVGASAASILALVIHELTANAVKYGGLSIPGGSVRVSWQADCEGLELQWREAGGPEVAEPNRRGFGRSLVEHAVPYELDGRSSLRFATTGVEVDIWVPAACIREAGSPREAGLQGAVRPLPSAPQLLAATPPVTVVGDVSPSRGPALVVEDSYVVAREFARILEDVGFSPVDCFGHSSQAEAAIRRGNYAFAVLDVNVRGAVSREAASLLRARSVPFVVATGYGRDFDLEDYGDAQVLTKPVFREDLLRAISLQSMSTGAAADPGT